MSGNTGKMTTDAIRARGPRLVLGQVQGRLVIYREGETFRDANGIQHIPAVLAKSYTKSYLRRLAKAAYQRGT